MDKNWFYARDGFFFFFFVIFVRALKNRVDAIREISRSDPDAERVTRFGNRLGKIFREKKKIVYYRKTICFVDRRGGGGGRGITKTYDDIIERSRSV